MNNKYSYVSYSFLAGFSLMTVELAASRIISPIIGNSIYTWTSIIGIILLGLSFGSYWGGKVADRSNTDITLPLAFMTSSFVSLLIYPLSQHADWIIESIDSVVLINLLISLYLFFIPAVAIGTIQPIILKKYSSEFSKIGSEYGFLSMVWSIGSIAGVFLTGFYFISNLGNKGTICTVAFILALTSLVVSLKNKKKNISLFSIIILITILITYFFYNITNLKSKIIYNRETNYYSVKIVDFDVVPYGTSRMLILDYDSHSVESKNKTGQYTEIYPVFKYLNYNLKKILIIGAGAYTLPKNIKDYYPDSEVSVIEIDPEIEKISERYFSLNKNKIKTIIGDARHIINKNKNKYI